MVPAPTTAARLISLVGVSFGTSGTFATSRSAKNRCRSALDSVEATQSANSSRSRTEPSSNGSCQPRFDGVDDGVRRAQALGGLLQRRAHRVARLESGVHAVGRDHDLAHLADLARLRLALRERDRAGEQVAVDDVIDDAGGERLRRPRPACRRCTSASASARAGADGAAAACRRRPGMMPSITSGWPTLASFAGDAEVARLRDFEAAAERVAVNRGDERLGRVFHALEQRVRAAPSAPSNRPAS